MKQPLVSDTDVAISAFILVGCILLAGIFVILAMVF